MEHNLNTEQKDFFSGIVANPTEVGATHVPQLKALVELYPQSGILRALLARASQIYDQNGFQQKLKSAAVYAPDRAVLYNLINYPEKLAKYIEPFNDVVEEEEETAVFEEGYNSYQYDNENAEEQVYESEPINYFHESEEEVQHTLADRANYNPVAEPVQTLEREEYLSHSFNPAQAEEAIASPATNEFNNDTAYAEVQPIEQATAEYDYITPAYQPEESVIADYTNPAQTEELIAPLETSEFNYDAQAYQKPEPFIEQATAESNYGTPDYQQNELQAQPVASDYDYNPSYREEAEEEPYNLSGIPEPALPPIPGFNTALSYQERSAKATTEIDDEVYDEITGIDDIYLQGSIKPKAHVPDITDDEEPAITAEADENNIEQLIQAQYGDSLTATVAESSIEQPCAEPEVAQDYKAAAYAEGNETLCSPNDLAAVEAVPEVAEAIPSPVPAPQPEANVIEPQFATDDARISKYNDDKMPYSFMWWLDKVRKEHAESHQPYVAFKPIITEVQVPAVTDKLQQQYFENIFHITSVEQLDMNTRDKRKESEIIDRFIQEDPQLKPPNTEKIDNENKAKKSAEDKNELVSETLARIYLDQMLYTKAIATYQKLLLKFPEKSSYFVAQIKLLEKKIN